MSALTDSQLLESLLKKANANDAAAQARLGNLYLASDGVVKQDYTEAKKWLEMAQRGGSMYARIMLGLMYMEGLGVEKNDNRAVEFLTAPAENGITMAQVILGRLLLNGQLAGGNDTVKAEEWISKAEASGITDPEEQMALAMEFDVQLKHPARFHKVLWSEEQGFYYSDNQDFVINTPPRIALYGKEGICVYAQTKQLERIGYVPWGDAEFKSKLFKLFSGNVTDSIILLCNETGTANDKTIVPEAYLGSARLTEFIRSKQKKELLEGHYFSAIKNNCEGPPHTYNSVFYKPSPELLDKVIDVIPSGAKALTMLHMETTDLTIELARKLSTSDNKLKRWCALVGQVETGGVRHVITDGSNMIISRLGPLPAFDSAKERVELIEKDFAVISPVLRHFGYSPEMGMDVVFICDNEEEKLYSPSAQPDVNMHFITLHDAMDKLGIDGRHLPATRFADPLYAGWVIKRSTLRLPFLSPDFRYENLLLLHCTNAGDHELVRLYKQCTLLLQEDRYAEAETVAKKKLELSRELYGTETMDFAQNLRTLGKIYSFLDNHEEAMRYFRDALPLVEKLLGPDHPGVAPYLNSIASVHDSMKDTAAAEAYYRRVIALCDKSASTEGQQALAWALQRLAGLQLGQQKVKEAETLYLRSVALGEMLFQPDDHRRFRPMFTLGTLYESTLQDYTKATSCFEFVVAAGEKVATAGIDLSATLDRLGKLHLKTHHFDKAIPVFHRAHEIYKKEGGKGVVTSLAKIAEAYCGLKDYAKAQDFGRQAVAAYEENFGPVGESPLALGSIMSDLAAAYMLTDNNDIAEPLFLRVLSLYENASPSWGPKVAFVLEQLAAIDVGRRDFVQAEPRVLRAMELREKVYGATHETMAVPLALMATICRETGREYQHLFDRAEYIRKLHTPHQA